MRINYRSAFRARQRPRGLGNGFAVLVVLVLLAIMASLAIGNNIALAHLKRELQLVERRQQRHNQATNTTNGPQPRAIRGQSPGSGQE